MHIFQQTHPLFDALVSKCRSTSCPYQAQRLLRWIVRLLKQEVGCQLFVLVTCKVRLDHEIALEA